MGCIEVACRGGSMGVVTLGVFPRHHRNADSTVLGIHANMRLVRYCASSSPVAWGVKMDIDQVAHLTQFADIAQAILSESGARTWACAVGYAVSKR